MPESGAHFSGEGHLIEGQIEGDPNKTVTPIACDSDGHLIIDLDASTITIGTVDQGTPNTPANAWPVKLVDAGGVNEAAVDATGDVQVDVNNFPATQNVNVTGNTTDFATQTTLAEVEEDLDQFTFSATRLVVDGSQVTQPVSGTVTVVQPTGTNLHTVVDSGSISITGTPNVNVTNGAGAAAVNIQDGGNSITVDGTVTTSPPANASTNLTQVGGSAVSLGQKTSANSIPVVIASDQSAVTVTGTVTTSPNVNVHDGTGVSISSTGSSLNVDVTNTVPVTLTSTTITGNVTVVQPTGTNLHTVVDSGSITVNNAAGASAVNIQDGGNSITVDGTVAVSNFPATQPVSGTVTANQGTANTAANKWPIEIVDSAGVNIATVDATGDLQVDVNNFPATQNVNVTNAAGAAAVNIQDGGNSITVDGTVTANIGTTGGIALDATLTNSTQKTQIVQGGNTAVVDAAGDLQVDVNNFPATQAVSGTVTANQGTANTAANKWPIEIVDSGGVNIATVTAANAVKVDGSAVTQPVSGTVTANQGTANTAANKWPIEIVDSAGVQIASVVSAGAGGGAVVTTRTDGYKGTYSAAVLGLVAAATPTDIFTIYGSASKTVRIFSLILSATQNTAAIRDVQLLKRSATNTGGTSTSPTRVSRDSANPAATATVLAYTANPTALGTLVGLLRSEKVDIPATNLVGAADKLVWNFGDSFDQAIVLRGTTEGVAVNLNGVTSSSNSFNISINWTEE